MRLFPIRFAVTEGRFRAPRVVVSVCLGYFGYCDFISAMMPEDRNVGVASIAIPLNRVGLVDSHVKIPQPTRRFTPEWSH